MQDNNYRNNGFNTSRNADQRASQPQQRLQVREIEFWTDKSKKIPKVDLFSTQAENLAKVINQATLQGKVNTFTQIRNFYDAVLQFKSKLLVSKEDFTKTLPYIKMLNAKFAYAKARGTISKECQDIFSKCITKIDDYDDFILFADFFESFMAFYRQYNNK
jgi:CRISPR-associated protein Csm2